MEPNLSMTNRNEELSKHGWKFLAGFISVVLVTITTLFFYTGNILSGLIMTGILVLLLVSASKKERNIQLRNAAGLGNGRQNSAQERAAAATAAAADQPPSYRLTWRRSFIKKLRGASESVADPEAVTTVSGGLASFPNPTQLPEPTSTGERRPSVHVQLLTNLDAMVPQGAEIIVGVKSSIADDGRTISSESVTDEGLPSFEEATQLQTISLENVT